MQVTINVKDLQALLIAASVATKAAKEEHTKTYDPEWSKIVNRLYTMPIEGGKSLYDMDRAYVQSVADDCAKHGFD